MKDVMSSGCRTLEFSVKGKPVPQARPRFAGHAYDPTQSRKYKKLVREAAEEAAIMSNWTMAHKDMPIKMSIVIYKQLPANVPIWYRTAALNGLIAPLKKTGDIENIAKGIMDAMSDLVYVDDCQVYSLSLEQRFAEEPRVDVIVNAMFVNNGDLKDAVKILNRKEASNNALSDM